jgi:putative transposase
MNSLYQTLGISKQAAHQFRQQQVLFEQQVSLLVILAEAIRAEHPGCGIEKMYYTLKPSFLGRDKFIDLFMRLGFRLQRKKNFRRTTYSHASKFKNLIQGKLVAAPCVIWQSDITYIDVEGKFYYAVFIIDVYTKMIVGFSVSDNMRVEANLEALRRALKNHKAPQIHHSDKGSQYHCKQYMDILLVNQTKISMGEKAQDNAYAERINKTMKEEYLSKQTIRTFAELKDKLSKNVKQYNTRRLHNHLGRMTPVEFTQKWQNKELKPIPKIRMYEYTTNQP